KDPDQGGASELGFSWVHVRCQLMRQTTVRRVGASDGSRGGGGADEKNRHRARAVACRAYAAGRQRWYANPRGPVTHESTARPRSPPLTRQTRERTDTVQDREWRS